MWYYPLNLNREFARLNRLAHGLLGHSHHRHHRHHRHRHNHHHHGFWHPAWHACSTPDPETKQLTEGEEPEEQKSYLRPHFHGDLNEEKDTITLKADMPGVEKKHLELEATASKINLKAESEERAYKATVPLRYKIDPKSAKASLKNGLLEIELKLAKPLKEKATKIKID